MDARDVLDVDELAGLTSLLCILPVAVRAFQNVHRAKAERISMQPCSVEVRALACSVEARQTRLGTPSNRYRSRTVLLNPQSWQSPSFPVHDPDSMTIKDERYYTNCLLDCQYSQDIATLVTEYLCRHVVLGKKYAAICLYGGFWCRAVLLDIDWDEEVLKLRYTGWGEDSPRAKCEVYINSILIRELDEVNESFLSVSMQDYSNTRRRIENLSFPEGVNPQIFAEFFRYRGLYYGASNEDE